MKNAYNNIIMCRKQLPTIEERLERVMGDIGPQEIEENKSEVSDGSDFFYGPNAFTKNRNSDDPFEKSAEATEEGDHFFNQQPDEYNVGYYSPIENVSLVGTKL